MTRDEALELRHDDPLVYVGRDGRREPYPVRCRSFVPNRTGYVYVYDGDFATLAPVRMEHLRLPTPDELLTLEWPSLSAQESET